jgi:biotin-[acetyl-CoA-carboxylase] ligase BirA-like protein
MMIQFGNEDISGWARQIDTLIGQLPASIVQRVVVVESIDSTQDAALRFARGKHGLLIVASEQKNGRGSFGRHWHDCDRTTLPCTFVVDPGCKDAPMLASCVACAVHEALASMLPSSIKLGIKWPNDIVVHQGEKTRKVGGILIEQREGLTLVGVGINCFQSHDDWPVEFCDHAESLLGLGVSVSRVELACRLVASLSDWFEACDQHTVRHYYNAHNSMLGTVRAFRYHNACYSGVVTHMDPLVSVTLRTTGGMRTLPIAQIEHIREHQPTQ